MVGLTLATTRDDLVKAILEGTTYEIAYNVRQMVAAGVTISELRAIGGGAKSSKWLQIKSDILGVPLVRLNVSEAACLGAAILAGHGAGLFDDVAAAADRLAAPVDSVEPDVANHARHSERLAAYERLYPALRELLHEL